MKLSKSSCIAIASIALSIITIAYNIGLCVFKLTPLGDDYRWGTGRCESCRDYYDFITESDGEYLYACRWCYHCFYIHDYRGDAYPNRGTK